MPENDLFESLTTMTHTDLHPLPASEVRRRGDRLRRRNTALAVAGGTVAAMTAIGVPLALTQGGPDDGDAGLVATEGPSQDAVEWRTEIPEDFPLTRGMPQTNTYSGTPVEAVGDYQAQSVGPCGGEAWDVTGALDVLQAVWQDLEGGEDRTLTVHEDDDAAAARLDALTEQVQTCNGGRISVVPLASSSIGGGEQSVVFANVWNDGTAYLHQAVRWGNAVLYTTSYFNGGGDAGVIEQQQDRVATDTRATVERMCLFRAGGCGL